MSHGSHGIPRVSGEYGCVYEPGGDVYPGPNAGGLIAGRHYDQWVPNDHCFIKGCDGRWHVFGITHPMTPMEHVHAGENQLFHAVAPPGNFIDAVHAGHWQDCDKVLASPLRPDEMPENHAPHIVWHNGLFQMLYGPTPLRLATSTDLWEWQPRGELSGAPEGRDPNVLLWQGEFHIVACIENRVVMALSKDLRRCTGTHTILTMPEGVSPESPFLVRRDSGFYLFVCGWNGVWDRSELGGAYQHVTHVFQSDDPHCFSLENEVARLQAHAPELIEDEDGNWFISSVEWPWRGVSVAPLVWQ